MMISLFRAICTNQHVEMHTGTDQTLSAVYKEAIARQSSPTNSVPTGAALSALDGLRSGW